MKKTYHGATFYVEQDEREKYIFERVRRAPGVRLLIPDGKGNIIFNKEYRRELKGWDYRLPGGKVFDSLDEYLKADRNILTDDAKKAGIKEAREEQGIEVTDLELFDVLHCGATVEWDLYYFVVKKFTELSGGQALETDEKIEICRFPYKKAIELCMEGKVREGRSASVLMRFLSSATF